MGKGNYKKPVVALLGVKNSKGFATAICCNFLLCSPVNDMGSTKMRKLGFNNINIMKTRAELSNGECFNK